MLGRRVEDPAGVEAEAGTAVDGLGWLDARTTVHAAKVTAQRVGTADGHAVRVYDIHHGRTPLRAQGHPWLTLDWEPEGAHGCGERAVYGTSLHVTFEADSFRQTLLAGVARRR